LDGQHGPAAITAHGQSLSLRSSVRAFVFNILPGLLATTDGVSRGPENSALLKQKAFYPLAHIKFF